MHKLILTFWFIFGAIFLKAQETEIVIKKINNKTIKYRYEVLVDQPEIKHGSYESFYYNGKLKEKGNYQMNKKDGKWLKVYDNGTVIEVQYFNNDKKVGVWEKHLENNQVVELFDQEKQIMLEPIIQNVVAKYPPMARELEVEGIVEVELKMNADCSIAELKIIKDIGQDCGASALEAVNKIAFLKKKYSIGTCNTKTEIVKVEFKLE